MKIQIGDRFKTADGIIYEVLEKYTSVNQYYVCRIEMLDEFWYKRTDSLILSGEDLAMMTKIA